MNKETNETGTTYVTELRKVRNYEKIIFSLKLFNLKKVAKFDGHIKNSAVFKAVLKQIATLNKTTHRWSLREQFRENDD